MIRTLHHDGWLRVDLEPNGRLFRVSRSNAAGDGDAIYRTMAAALAAEPGGRLVVDLRDAPPGDRFAAALAADPAGALVRFGRVAVIAPSPVGNLRVFEDEDSAFDHALA